MNAAISLVGIILGLALLVFFSYKGLSTLLLAPMCAVIVAILSGMNVVDALAGPYMEGFASFMSRNYLIFLFGATFASMMGESGAAKSIAQALLKIMNWFPADRVNRIFAACLVIGIVNVFFTLGGVNLFVVMFVTLPIFKNLFESMDLPWHLVYTANWGSATLTMTMIPGNPSLVNLIPISYLGTDAKAAPVLGSICAVICFILILVYLRIVAKHCASKGEGFMETGELISQMLKKEDTEKDVEEKKPMNWLYCLVPSISILVSLNFLNLRPVTSLIVGNLFALVMFFTRISNLPKALGKGASNSIMTSCNTSVIVGFGAVVAATTGYGVILNGLTNMPGTPLIQIFLASNIAAGLTGSTSGGLTFVMESLSKHYLDMGINPQLIHRVSVISCGGLDSLPHNGSIVSSLQVHGLTYKQAYRHAFWLCLVIPSIVGMIAVLLGSIGIM